MKITAIEHMLDSLHKEMKNIQSQGTTLKFETLVTNAGEIPITAGIVLLAMVELRDLKVELNKLTSP